MDRVYGFLFAIALVAGIPAMLADPELSVLYIVMIAFAGFAARGVEYYRSILGDYVGYGSGDVRYALLGLAPAVLGVFFFSWTTDLLLGFAVAVMVAVAEETFRAGAVVVLDQTGLRGWPSIIAANVAWVSYHFVLRPFDEGYLLYLLLGAAVFTYVLVRAGVGVAALAHLLANGLSAWVAISSASAGSTATNLALGVFLVAIALILGVSTRVARR